jgi:hypothetical protein
LKNLTGLSGLIFIGKDLNISSNDSLISLLGLEGLALVRQNLSIQQNRNLSDCGTLCQLISKGGVKGVSSIANNPAPCSSVTVIQTLCTYGSGITALTIKNLPPSVSEGGLLTFDIEANGIVKDSLVVNIISSNEMEVPLPARAVILAGKNTVNVSIRLPDDAIAEPNKDITITVGAALLTSDKKTFILTNDTDIPKITFRTLADTLSEGAGIYATKGVLQRANTEGVLTVQFRTSEANALNLPTKITFNAGQREAVFDIGVFDNLLVDSTRAITITAEILLPNCNCAPASNTQGVVLKNIVIIDNDGPSLSITVNPLSIPEGVANGGSLTVTRNTTSVVPLVVRLSSSDTTELSLPPTITIPQGQASVTIPLSGKSDPIADGNQQVTIQASADGFSQGIGWVIVTDINKPDLSIPTVSLTQTKIPTATAFPFSVTIANKGFSAMPQGFSMRAYLSKDKTIDDGDFLAGDFTIGQSISINDSISFTNLAKTSAQPGSYYLIFKANYNAQFTELLYLNNTSEPIGVDVLPDYIGTAIVDKTTFLPNEPILVYGTSKKTDGRIVPNVALEVYITNGEVRREFVVKTDSVGKYQLKFERLPDEAGHYTVGASFPKLNSKQVQDQFDILGVLVNNGRYLEWQLSLNDTLKGSVPVKNLSNIALNNITLKTQNLPAGAIITFDTIRVLEGMQSSVINYTVVGRQVTTTRNFYYMTLNAISAEKTNQNVSAYYFCLAQKANLAANIASIKTSVSQNKSRVFEFKIFHQGRGETGEITVNVPRTDWLKLVSKQVMPSLTSSDTALVILEFIPTATLPFNTPAKGTVVISAKNSDPLSIPFSVEKVSTNKGGLIVDVVDNYTYFTAEAPHVKGAKVTISHYFTGQIYAEGLTNELGLFNADSLPEGTVRIRVQADKHEGYDGIAYVSPGLTNKEVVFIAYQAISFSWDVKPTTITDEYTIDLIMRFETNVPAPVVVMEMPDTIPQILGSDTYSFFVTMTNKGLITARDVQLQFPKDVEYEFVTLYSPRDLLAQQAIQVPVTMKRRGGNPGIIANDTNKIATLSSLLGIEQPGGTGGGSVTLCADFVITNFWFECGPEKRWQRTAERILYEKRFCITVTITDPPIGDPPPPRDPGPGGGNGWKWPDFEIPTVNINVSCNKCVNEFALAAAKCIPGVGTAIEVAETLIEIVECSDQESLIKCLIDKAVAEAAGKAVEKGAEKGVEKTVSYIEKLLPDGTFILIRKMSKRVLKAIPAIGCGVNLLEAAQSESCGFIPTIFLRDPNGRLGLRNDPKFPSILQVPLDNLKVTLDAYKVFDDIKKVYFGDIIANNENFRAFSQLFEPYMLQEIVINADQRQYILAEMLKFDMPAQAINNFIDKWNFSTQARNAGIYAPNATYPNIIDNTKLNSLVAKIDSAIKYANSKGYRTIEEMGTKAYDDIIRLTKPTSDPNQQSAYQPVCSSVSLKISQKLTMTREAFDGTLTVTNGNPDNPIQNLGLTLQVLDENGVLSNDLFQINTLSTSVLTGIDGTGKLAPNKSGTAVVRFIPTKAAAPQSPKTYSFGGYISYLDPYTGTKVTLPLIPVKLTVNPSPDLNLHYFMQRDILGDDALTPAIEPIIPAEFSVMIENNGYGAANNVVIESAQPKIIENEKGLAINFKLIGSNLQGRPAQMGVTNIPFGTIPAQQTRIGQWYFTSDLLGHFTQFETKLVHNNSFGNPNLSLISGVRLHELIKSVSVYGGADDRIDDFLVNDSPDIEDNPDAIYLSQGKVVYDVYKAQSARFAGDIQSPAFTSTLFVRPSILGWNYAKLDDPGRGNYEIVRVTRSDGRVIPLKNVWLSHVTLTDARAPIYEKKFHIVDDLPTQSEMAYNIVWKSTEQNPPAIVSISGQPTQVSSEQVKELTVKFNKPIDATTFGIDDLTLSLQGGGNLINASVSITPIDSVTFRINLNNVTSGSGYYVFTVQAATIKDKNGSLGREGKQVTWTQFISSTAAVTLSLLTEGALDPQHYTGITLTFNKKIRPLSISALQLLKNGVVQSLNAATLTKIADNVYVLNGFGTLTYPDAAYIFNVDMSKVLDTLGNAGTGVQDLKWAVKRTTTLAINNLNITPDLGYSNADGITSTLQLTTTFTLTENAKEVTIYQNDNGFKRVLAVLGNKTAGAVSVPIALNSGGNTIIEVIAKDDNNTDIIAQKVLYIDETALSAKWSLASNQILPKHPDSLIIYFSEKLLNTEGVTDSVLQVTFNNNILRKDGLTLQKLSDSTYILRGMSNLQKKGGTYTIGIDVRAFKKYRSGLSGNDISFVSWTLEKPNQNPIADAGKDTLVTQATQLVLDGSKSFDPDGDSLTYTWYPPTGIVLDNINSSKPSFMVTTAQQGKTLSFIVSVSDGSLSSTDVVNVKVNLKETFLKLNINPNTVCAGETMNINWQANGVDTVNIALVSAAGIPLFQLNRPSTIANYPFAVPRNAQKCENCLVILRGVGVNSSLRDSAKVSIYPIDSTVTTIQTCDNTLAGKSETKRLKNRNGCDSLVTISYIKDTISPTIVCKNTSLVLPTNNAPIVLDITNVLQSFSDNCELDTIILSKTTFDRTNLGLNTVTITIKDKAGNTNKCVATVTILDNQQSPILCNNQTIQLNESGKATLTVNDVVTIVDNTKVDSVSLSQSLFDCTHIGVNQVTVTATMNKSTVKNTCTATITVLDKILPKAVCKDVTVSVPKEGRVVISPDLVSNNSTDNCGIDSFILSKNTFDCSNIGDNQVTLKVKDKSGNASECAAKITIVDREVPTLLCKSINLVMTNLDTVFTLKPSDLLSSFADNCGIETLTLSKTQLDYDNIGQTTITIVAKDKSGNISQCVSTVTIEDKTPNPCVFNTISTLSKQQEISVCVGDGQKDPAQLTNSLNRIKAYAYVLTTADFKIVKVFTDANIDVETLPAEGTWIWGFDYRGSIIAEVGESVFSTAFATQCRHISNTAVKIFRTQAQAGNVQTAYGQDAYFACQNDPFNDIIGFANVNASNAPYVYLLTSESNKILSIITQGYFDFTTYPQGNYRVWGLSYTGQLQDIMGKNAATDVLASGCFNVSKNYITIGVGTVKESDIAMIGKSDYYLYLDDNKDATIRLSNTASAGANYAYLVINESQNIIQIVKDTAVNIANLPTGKYFIWGISYIGNLDNAVGKNLWSGNVATGCYRISTTAITIDKTSAPEASMPSNSTIYYGAKTLKTHHSELTLTLYPNPASDMVQVIIQSDPDQPVLFILRDALGKIVYQQAKSSQNAMIDISQFTNGLYILTARQGDRFVQKKLVKASGK